MSELYIKQEIFKTLPKLDAILLDVDGVVMDVAESFRVVVAQTVQHYATAVLGLQNTGALLELDEIELFKLAGGFNSDWDLANAAVALVLAKRAQSSAADTASLRAQAPGWAEFTQVAKRNGGGLKGAEAFILQTLNPTQRRNFANAWQPDLVIQLFQERYAGDEMCKELYGFEPTHIHGEGLYKNEKVLLDKELLPANLKTGVLTGRTHSENKLAMTMAKLPIPPSAWQTADEGISKPDGGTLLKLQEKMGFKFAVYLGDTMDDLNVVLNYRELHGSGRAKILSCIVLSGPAGEKHRRLFLEAGADIIAPDANTFLEYLKVVR
jgi:HAD superfamily hydrolase (TIGR01548 family)